MVSAPLEIRLTATKNGVRATLRNLSSTTQTVLHDSLLQPSSLELTGPGGSVITPFDSRSIKKFDNTVRESSFTDIGAGKEIPLFDAEVQNGELRWGPYQYKKLAPGTYTAKAVFHSAVDSYQDGGSTKKKAGVWLGTVTSAPVTFQVP
jgi:hypothetical protein